MKWDNLDHHSVIHTSFRSNHRVLVLGEKETAQICRWIRDSAEDRRICPFDAVQCTFRGLSCTYWEDDSAVFRQTNFGLALTAHLSPSIQLCRRLIDPHYMALFPTRRRRPSRHYRWYHSCHRMQEVYCRIRRCQGLRVQTKIGDPGVP